MSFARLALAACAVFALVACTAEGAVSINTPASATPSPSASPSSGTSVNVGVDITAPPAGGNVTLEQMKGYSTCLKGSGAAGASLASAVDGRIAAAELMIGQGQTAAAQTQLNLAYNTAAQVESSYNINCFP
ncbi:MAG: hypothetical protein ACO1RX_05065 [Candidatus Sericytochromatia bacterium]